MTKDFLDRVEMKPSNAHALVNLTVQVRAEAWGEDCTVAQAVAQAVESAKNKLRKALGTSGASGMTITGAEFVRVVCDAERRK